MMYGPKTMVIRMENYRYLQEQALKNGTDPMKELDRMFERAKNPAAAATEDELSAAKRAAAERMAYARSKRKIEQHA